MKFLCFLISILIVKVWANNKKEYLKEMFITNALIKQAYNMNDCFIEDKYIANGLEHIIKTVVFKGKHSLDAMNHMFVIPGCPYFNKFQKTKQLFDALKTEFLDELKIAARDVPTKDFTNSTFKQLGDERRVLTGIALRNIISKTMDDENKVPRVGERGDCKPFQEGEVLVKPDVNDDSSTSSSLDLSFACVQDKSELNEDEDDEFFVIDQNEFQDDENSVPPSIEQLEIIENYIGQDGGQPSSKSSTNTNDAPLNIVCQYIALFSSTNHPTLYLFARTDEKLQTCIITKKNIVLETHLYLKINEKKWCPALMKLLG